MRNDRAGTLRGPKIVSFSALKSKIKRLKQDGKRIVFTNGCFDILHYGHVKYLQDARKKGDYLIVAVNSDSSVREIKTNNRPIVPQADRLRVVAALGCVDFVILFKENNPFNLIKAFKPDVLVKGSDWDRSKIVGADFVESYGGKVLTIKLLKGRSTSAIIKKIILGSAKK